MPLPIPAGMGVLAGFAWLVDFFVKRLALIAIFITLIGTFYTTMLIVVGAATAVVSTSVPDWLSLTLSYFLPSQTGAAMAVVMTARVARWIYETSIKIAVVVVLAAA